MMVVKHMQGTGGVYVWLGRSARTGRGNAQTSKLTFFIMGPKHEG
jgi:hypothetical protein